jgi:hypothetical protein
LSRAARAESVSFRPRRRASSAPSSTCSRSSCSRSLSRRLQNRVPETR